MRAFFATLALAMLMGMVTATCLLFKLPPQTNYMPLILYTVFMSVMLTGVIGCIRILYD